MPRNSKPKTKNSKLASSAADRECGPEAAMPSGGAATYETLAAFTGLGLTDRRYRQLAKDGFFPPPKDGQYQFVPTIRGLFAHLRQMHNAMAARRQAIADEQHRKIKMANDVAAGELVAKAKFLAEFRQTVQPIRDILNRLETEYPLAVAGMDVPQARIYGRRMKNDILAAWQKLFDQWKI